MFHLKIIFLVIIYLNAVIINLTLIISLRLTLKKIIL